MSRSRKTPSLRKKIVDRVIEECFWSGFQEGLVDGTRCGLEYASTSGLYEYNGVRRIAEGAGYDLAQELLANVIERRERKARGEFTGWRTFKYEVPGAIYAECYGEARLAVK